MKLRGLNKRLMTAELALTAPSSDSFLFLSLTEVTTDNRGFQTQYCQALGSWSSDDCKAVGNFGDQLFQTGGALAYIMLTVYADPNSTNLERIN